MKRVKEAEQTEYNETWDNLFIPRLAFEVTGGNKYWADDQFAGENPYLTVGRLKALGLAMR